jgi:hypothetical protein
MNIELRERSTISSSNPIQSLTLRSMFWGPHYLDDSDWLEYVPFGFWLIEALEPESILDVGGPDLVSYFSMCHAVARLNLDASCAAVGPQEPVRSSVDAHLERVLAWNDVHFHSFSSLVNARIQDYAGDLADGSVDLLHIDLCREKELSDAVVKQLLRKVSSRGVCLVHGTRVSRNSGLYGRLAAEFGESSSHFEFTHGAGLTLFAIGASPTNLVRSLCSMAILPAARQAVREVFSRLGHASFNTQTLLQQKRLNRELVAAVGLAAPQADGGSDELVRANREIAYLTDLVLKQSLSTSGQAVSAPAPGGIAGQASAAAAAADILPVANEQVRAAGDNESAMKVELERLKKQTESYKTEARQAQEHRRQKEQELAKLTELVLGRDRIIEQQNSQLVALDQRPAPSAWGGLLRRLKLRRRRKPSRLERETKLLQESTLFDAAWYARTYLHDAGSGTRPEHHFLTAGGRQGYHPSDAFDTLYYLEQYPDVVRSGMNPLIHYLKFGVREQRKTRAVSSS